MLHSSHGTYKTTKISTLDRIDGGISVLLRCPGFKPSEGSGAEHMTIDTYISPHELKAGGKDLTKHIALLVQSFGADIALPHLHRFEARCAVEGVRPPSVPGIVFIQARQLTTIIIIHSASSSRQRAHDRWFFLSPSTRYKRWTTLSLSMPSCRNVCPRHHDP